MACRIIEGVKRGPACTVSLNDQKVATFEGETIASVILLSDDSTCKLDKDNKPRAPFCNMGVCYDCLVTVIDPTTSALPSKLRACMVPVKPGQKIYIGVYAETFAT